MVLETAAWAASLLRGHSSPTSASCPSSAASVHVPCLLHLCLSSLQNHSSLTSIISFFSCFLVRFHGRI
jgi:hypothetical protein